MKQKLGIAQAIMEGQDILLLDEPFNGLDFQTNKEVMAILLSLKKEGKTIVLTCHQQNYLEQLCDEIYIILENDLKIFDQSLKQEYFSMGLQ